MKKPLTQEGSPCYRMLARITVSTAE